MNEYNNEMTFDALLKAAADEALHEEMNEMPSLAELDALYRPSPIMGRRLKRYSFRRQIGRKLLACSKTLCKVAVFFIVVFTVTATVLMSVEATRNYIMNAIIQNYDDHTDFHFEGNEELDDTIAYMPAYIPEGYYEIDRFGFEEDEGPVIGVIEYQSADGEILFFDQYPAASVGMAIDSEDKIYVEIKINNNIGYLYVSEDGTKSTILVYLIEGSVFTIIYDGDLAEVIRIAESLTPVE